MHDRPTSSSAGPSGDGPVVYADAAAKALLREHVEALTHPDPARWELVKQNASRTVRRGLIEGQEIFLKHFHNTNLAHRLRRLLGRNDAMREMRFSQFLRSHDVLAPAPLAARMGRKGDWLVTKAVAPAVTVDEWNEPNSGLEPRGARAKQQAIREIARLIGRMHRAGVLHRDLHCGNLLLQTVGAPAGESSFRAVLMDLHRMSRRRRLSRRQMAKNLASLYHDRVCFTTRTERLRFLKCYLTETRRPGTLHGWAWLVEEFARRHTVSQHVQRDRRTFENNRYFQRVGPARGWRGHVVLASKRHLGGSRAASMVFRAEDWSAVLADPPALLDPAAGEVIKDSRSSTILRRKLRVGPHEVDVFIKRSRRKVFWKWLGDMFRSSRGLRAFRLGHALLTRRIATALPLAALEHRVGPVLLDSILITETVLAPHLYDFMNTWLSNPPKGDMPMTVPQQRQLAQEVLWQLGRMLQRLHDNRFAHRDLKATNIRVAWSPGTPPEVVLVDLDGLAEVRVMSVRRKFRGLMRLNVSLLQCPPVTHAGRLRMLLGYLRRPGCGRVRFKTWWRVLEDWSQRKLRQQIRSRRRRQKLVRRPAG
jgi:heptose I phosphotransferase